MPNTAALSPPRPRRPAPVDAPLRVLHSAPVWLPRTQTWMHVQLRNLPPAVEPHVVCERVAALDQFPVEHLHREPHRFGRALAAAGRLLGTRRHFGPLHRAVEATGARVLHSHFGHIGWCDARAAERLGLRHVVTFYGQDVHGLPQGRPVWRRRYAELFERVDLVLCEGPHMASCVADLGCPESRLRVHPLGVELDRLPFVARQREPDAPLRVLLAASFTEKKGLPDAIAALGRVAREIDVAVTLVGDAGPGSAGQREKARILEALAAEDLAGRTRRIGYCTHSGLLDLALQHDVFLQPSVTASDGDTEGGAPVTILEMAATGLPVVATRHCDIPAVLPEGCGLLAGEHDPKTLAEHVLTLARDPEFARTLGRAARLHLERGFDARRQGAALAALYAELCA